MMKKGFTAHAESGEGIAGLADVKNCVLFPIDNKPEIPPIEYQRTGEGEVIELDNRANEKRRKIKIRDVAGGNEISYERFKGVPTITFTDEDIGIYVRHCILILQKGQK